MNVTRWILPAALVILPVFAQSAKPEFEVASVRPSAQADNTQVKVGLHVDGAQVSVTYLSLKDYIRIAYKIKDYQISGPDWLASEHFDVAGKLPEGAPRDQVPDMLKALLEDRFKLKTHN